MVRNTAHGTPMSWQTCATAAPSISTASASGSADRSAARILGVAPGVPVLQVRRTALTFGDKPVEYRISTVNTAQHDYVSLPSRPA